ncbi:MAG: Cystathionine gamma-synthase [Candidatus Magasanikbacteria bacterium GW2011_GWA2_50_22]|uniref:Cystathionine gamma-synthase n=1 Tax=Candidatus Magasanikbacteria bacterium GW2011_GWA2_50_22 TaxID=1619043 RepID=A0A0G1YQK0_9BACT|nr:MAG: Cystathionine gamma-synthase [Candidatus Magasanikbacteria bacterium GW2011_GWA2_50_22]
MRFKTKLIHTGAKKDTTFNSVTMPIYATSTFAFDELGKNKGYDYTRSGNPTRAALEENIAALEGGVGCSITATGMAAIHTAMLFLKPGDHIIANTDIYGGTYRLFNDVLKPLGYKFSFVDMTDLDAVKNSVTANTKMIWIETPSNPFLHVTDIAGVVAIAKKGKILTIADNTFLSPYFQRPLELGVDIVAHSTTKYLNGHSDVVGGAIVYSTKELRERGNFLVNATGVSGSPFDSWLVLRGIKTLALRMEAHQKNALAIAQFLEGHKNVKRVYYPGLKSHPQQELIKKQMTGFGGIVTFELDTKKVPLKTFFKKLKYFPLAVSLGGVESLIEAPWFMTHASMDKEGLKNSGITEETVRVSAGIEDADDLIEDLENALKG